MARKLVKNVTCVVPQSYPNAGSGITLTPEDELPEWAEDVISNLKVWDDYDPEAEADEPPVLVGGDGTTSAETTTTEPGTEPGNVDGGTADPDAPFGRDEDGNPLPEPQPVDADGNPIVPAEDLEAKFGVDRDNYDGTKADALAAYADARGVDPSGTKKDLIARLQEADAQVPATPEATTTPTE